MKKTFTFLFAIGLFTAAVAQTGNRDKNQNDQWNNNRNRVDNDVARNDNRYDKDDRYRNSRYEMERRRDLEIARINRDYNYQAQKVRNNFFMSRYEKERRLRLLDEKRDREIRKLYKQYGNNGRDNDWYDRNDNKHH